MKIKHLIIILLPLVFSSFTSWMNVLVKIIDLEKEEEFLEIEFSFKDRSLENDVAISNIMIFKNDTLHYCSLLPEAIKAAKELIKEKKENLI